MRILMNQIPIAIMDYTVDKISLSAVQFLILLEKGLSVVDMEQYDNDPGKNLVHIFRKEANIFQNNQYLASYLTITYMTIYIHKNDYDHQRITYYTPNLIIFLH